MNAQHERLLRDWLDARDPGGAPSGLRTAAERVPYDFGRATFPRIDDVRVRFLRLDPPLRAALILLTLATLIVAVVGALILRPWQPFPPRGLIAFTSGSAVRLVAADGTGGRDVTPTTDAAYFDAPRWSADGRTLMLARYELLDEANYCSGQGSIVLYDVATATLSVLATGLPPIGAAEWSPLGTRIAVNHPAPGCSGSGYLSVIEVASGRVTTSSVGEEGPWRWSWSAEVPTPVLIPLPTNVLEVPAGNNELVARCDSASPFRPGPIEVEDRATGTTFSLGVGASPAWSPDGRTLAFASVPEPLAAIGAQRFQLAVAGRDGWQVQLLGDVIAVSDLTSRSFRQLELRWTPDGSAIYWTDARGGHVVDVATGRFAELPAAVGESSDPRWQPPTR